MEQKNINRQRTINNGEFKQSVSSSFYFKPVFEQTVLRIGKKQSPNFIARYVNGNKQNLKGLKNIHLNIRSLGNKITDVKNIILDHRPHIFGLSECELRKVNGKYDEGKLKIPGYDVFFPQSWSKKGFARVIVYIKKGLNF